MKKDDRKFYIVREDILPTSILKTALAKEMLHRGDAANILEAVDAQKMARSTFYKYKDGVFPFFDSSEFPILNISMTLKNMPGILSSVLNHIAKQKGNVLTINQNIPIQGTALVTLSIDMEEANIPVAKFIASLEEQEGVYQVQMIGRDEKIL